MIDPAYRLQQSRLQLFPLGCPYCQKLQSQCGKKKQLRLRHARYAYVSCNHEAYNALILMGFRLDMNQALPERLVYSEDDFDTLLLIGHKLLLHATMMYQMLPKSKDAVPGEIGQSLIQKQFFQMLPADFTKQDAVKMAEVLGVNNKTIEYWLANM